MAYEVMAQGATVRALTRGLEDIVMSYVVMAYEVMARGATARAPTRGLVRAPTTATIGTGICHHNYQ